jgi:hypothetical protein
MMAAMRRLALLALLVAACGDDGPASHLDGGMTDSTVDAPGPPAVTLTVTRGGLPNAGVTVYFQNADSVLVATKQTDSTGTASQVMDAGGFVTAVDPFELAAALPTKQIKTFAGVKPGDHLKLEEQPQDLLTITVIGPTETDAALAYYEIISGCSPAQHLTKQASSSASATFQVYGCPAQTDFQLVAFDANGRVISSLYAPNQALYAFAQVNLSAMSFTAPTDRTYTFTNVPSAFVDFRVTDRFVSAKGALGAAAGGLVLASTTTLTMKAPVVADAVSLVTTQGGVGRTGYVFLDWGPFATTYTTDIGARRLREFTSDLTYSATNHTVTWTETAGLAPDFVELTGSARRGNEGFNIEWDLIAPYSAGSVTLPALPPGMYDLNFSDTDLPDWVIEMNKVPGGYDAVRAGFFVKQGPVGTTGTATKVRWEPAA